MNDHKTKWLANVQPRRNALLRLFCFPFAGGSTSVFHNWQTLLLQEVEIYPVQLPGRGLRLSEPPFGDMTTLTGELAQALSSFMESDFAFFGHSMGALIAFELARKLRNEHRRQPLMLFVSGREAPHVPDSGRLKYDLPDPEFIALLRELKGTPSEILKSREMLDLILPVLRADFKLVQSYNYAPDAPLALPIKAYGGLLDEHANRSGLELWSRHTSEGCSVSMLQGGHFFFQEFKQQFMNLFAADLVSAMQLKKRVSVSARS